MRAMWVMGLLGWGACGAAAGEGGGAENLPSRAAGPYGKLEPDPETAVLEPVLLADPDGLAHYRSPALRAEEGGTYTVFFAAESSVGVKILRASGVSLTDVPGDVVTVLEAEASWEATRVDHPGLILPGVDHEVGLFYEAGVGAIGYAGSPDGASFERHPMNPVLEGDGLEEGDLVGEPSAVWHQGDLWLYYAAWDRGAIFVARFPAGDLGAPERLDADPRTEERDPVLGPNPFAEQFDLGGVGAPFARITSLAGRPVFDLWYGGWDGGGQLTVGFAGSSDGLVFKRFDDNPVLPAGGVLETDPCVITVGIGALMLFTQRSESEPEVIAGARH